MGAGINLFKTLFPSDYYPYTANTLMSAKPTGKKIVGFNQWDEEWELGSFSWGTGQPFADNTRIRNKNYIPVFPNINYFNSNSGYAVDYYFYDADKNFISPLYKAAGNQTITTPANCYYMNFCVYAAYGTTYNHDICINISDANKNGTYEPYTETTIVYSGNELRGILKVGTNGLYADGDIDDGSGSTAIRYGKTALSSLASKGWNMTAGGIFYLYPLSNALDNCKSPVTSIPLCEDLSYQVSGTLLDHCFRISDALYIYISSIDNVTDFRTWLSNSTASILYELASPTTATSTAWNNPIVAKEGGTETFVDTRTIALPTGHDTIYGTDLSVKKAEFGTTVYGGSIDFTTGEVISNKNADGTDKTAETIAISPVMVGVFEGDNNIVTTAGGNNTVKYYKGA